MPKLKIKIRRDGPLDKSSGAVTTTDVYEKADYPAERTREFTDALTRAIGPVTPGIPTHMKEQGRWQP